MDILTARTDERCAFFESFLNRVSHYPILHYGSGPLRVAFGACQIALGALHFVSQLFYALGEDPEAEESCGRGLAYIFHGAANWMRGSIEALPLAFVLTWLYDCAYPHRFNYKDEWIQLGVYPLNHPVRAICYVERVP